MSIFDLYYNRNMDDYVSDKWESYISIYDRVFKPLRGCKINLVEIGVQNGGSLDVWSKYFSSESSIVGVDIDKRIGELNFFEKNIELMVGDATSDEVIAKISEFVRSIDVFIDDGAHSSSQVIKTFNAYFSMMTNGGIYIVEDTHCAYWDKFQGGLTNKLSSLAFFKQLTDVVNREHWGIDLSVNSYIKDLMDAYDCKFNEASFKNIQSIEFLNSMVIIRKGVSALGRRVVSGGREPVSATLSNLNPYIDKFDETLNPTFCLK